MRELELSKNRDAKQPLLRPVQRRSYRGFWSHLALAGLGICAGGFCVSAVTQAVPVVGSVWQQDFEVRPIAKEFDLPVILEGDPRDVQTEKRAQQSSARAALRDANNELREIARGNRSISESFSKYVREYWLASMTQTDDVSLSEMGKRRNEMLRTMFPTEATPAYRQQLIESLLLPELQSIADQNFHPAARLNAVTIIGMLNNIEGGSTTAPTPNMLAVRYLFTLIENESAPLYVRVGAFSGLQRAAQIHGVRPLLEEAEVNRLTAFSQALLAGTVPGQDAWTTDASYWMKRRAVQTLGGLRRPGANGEVTQALNNVLADKGQPVWLRYDALTALGQLKHSGAATAFVADTVYGMASLTGDTAIQEAAQVRADLEELIAVNLLLSNTSLQKIGDSKKDAGGPQAGTGGLAEEDPGRGSGGNAQGERYDGPEAIEMPTYYLNAVRKKAKTYSALSQAALKEKNFQEFATAEEKQLIADAVKILDRLFKESDVGLRDLSKNEPPLETRGDQTKAITNQLITLLKEAGEGLNKIASRKPQPGNNPPSEGGN